MHTKTMKDSEGDFSGWEECKSQTCSKCGSKNVKYRTWESSCGGYEDYQYKCENGHIWWIDGIDS